MEDESHRLKRALEITMNQTGHSLSGKNTYCTSHKYLFVIQKHFLPDALSPLVVQNHFLPNPPSVLFPLSWKNHFLATPPLSLLVHDIICEKTIKIVELKKNYSFDMTKATTLIYTWNLCFAQAQPKCFKHFCLTNCC